MFSKEQIINEMKRIAAGLGGAISERDFEQRSTIPLTTLRFHLGSWQRALKEAGLKPGEKVPEIKPQSDDELLLELIRLHQDSGELPTPALIEAKSKYKTHHYIKRWKSIAEAFQRAKDKFPEKIKAPPKISNIFEIKEKREAERLQQLEQLEQLEKEAQLENIVQAEESALEKTIVQEEEAAPDETIMEVENEAFEKTIVQMKQIEQKDLMEKAPAETIQEVQEMDDSDVMVLEGEHEMNHNHQGIKGEKIKFIPKTIKPEKAKIKPRVSVEPLEFRGLRFAPASRQGVVYLFGMISHELGYIIESFVSDFPDCEGKRCVDQDENQWEPIRIQFEFKSSDFKTRVSAKGYNENQCDLIVCWNHNWEQSPIEVLELRSVLQYLQ